MRGGQTMAAVDPQTRGDRAAVYLRQLLRRQGRTKISISFAHQRQRQITIRLRQTVIARPAALLRDQAGRAAVFQTSQQTKGLCCKLPGVARDALARGRARAHAASSRSPTSWTASVNAHGPRPKARSTRRASPTMSRVRLKIAA